MTCAECAWFRRADDRPYGQCRGAPPQIAAGFHGMNDGLPWAVWPVVHETEQQCGAFRFPADYKSEQPDQPLRFGGE